MSDQSLVLRWDHLGGLDQEAFTFTMVQSYGLLNFGIGASAMGLHGVDATGLHQVNDVHPVDLGETLGKVCICGIRTGLCYSTLLGGRCSAFK